MKPARFGYVAPADLAGVHAALADSGDDCKLLAGGQSLGPLLNLRLATPSVLVDLERVAALSSGIKEEPEALWVPAMTRHRELEVDGGTARLAPLLAQALPYVAHRTIRNRGTLGGSLAHADPAAELPTVAVASDAVIVVEDARRRREIPASEFFHGFFTTALASDEVIVGVRFPRPADRSGTGWAEFAPRHGDFAVVGVAVRVELTDDTTVRTARIACAGVADTPWRATQAEQLLGGVLPTPENLAAAATTAAAEASPRADATGSTAYRKNLVDLLARQAFTEAVSIARGS
jgi:aerobic carbon-monoxide dehydrogenase medium subunit